MSNRRDLIVISFFFVSVLIGSVSIGSGGRPGIHPLQHYLNLKIERESEKAFSELICENSENQGGGPIENFNVELVFLEDSSEAIAAEETYREVVEFYGL